MAEVDRNQRRHVWQQFATRGSTMEKLYVERHDGGYWVTGTRVSLDSVVLGFS